MKLKLHITTEDESKRQEQLDYENEEEEEVAIIPSRTRTNRSSTRNKLIIQDNDYEEEVKGPQQFLNEDPTLHGMLTSEEADVSETVLEEEDYDLYKLSLNYNNSSTRDIQPALHPQSRTNNNNNRVTDTGRSGKASSSIRKVYFGTNVSVTPWYSAPYPSEYHCPSGELWICEFCLKYMRRPEEARRHLLKCNCRLPPGDEIYRDVKAGISVFEINGRDSKLYCQNLCLLAKMFLDHKTLYYDVDPFLFYVLIEWKALILDGCTDSSNNNTNRFTYSFVGYFSKEKVNPAGFNVSCILTMPHHQRKGYGSFLIDFSYLLSRREKKLGSPEKPLSDLGLFSYVSYWKNKLISYFSNYLLNFHEADKDHPPPSPFLTVETISAATGMTENDILSTLEYLKMLRFDVIKPVECNNNNNNKTSGFQPVLKASIVLDLAIIESYQNKMRQQGGCQLEAKDEFLRWYPFNCTR